MLKKCLIFFPFLDETEFESFESGPFYSAAKKDKNISSEILLTTLASNTNFAHRKGLYDVT